MPVEEHDFSINLPVGICSTCLARLSDRSGGMPARIYRLTEGRTLWAVYCPERQSGAWTILGGNDPTWTIRTPIDVAQFHDYAARLPLTIAGAEAALHGADVPKD